MVNPRMAENHLGKILNEDEAMALAIAEARKGMATVGDNPAVGCVITNAEGKVLSTGFHRKSGEAHAEVEALNNLPKRTDLTDCRMYVTLEPCAFEGRTGSCARKIAELPLSQVIVGVLDPHPQVNGAGVEILRKAGKQVVVYQKMQAELLRLIEIFSYTLKYRRTFVSLKMATTLDGQIALTSGESQWITGEKARQHSHLVRSYHDAILIGRNTLQTDNPSLNIRYGPHQDKKLKIIVLDPLAKSAKSLAESQIFKTHGSENIVLVTRVDSEFEKREWPKGITHISVPALSSGQIDLTALKVKLFELGIRSVMVEGGGVTYSAFLNQGAVQRVYQYIALSYMGSAGSIASTVDMQILKMKDQIRLKNSIVKKLGPDILVTGQLNQS